MGSIRLERINREIQRIVSDILRSRLKDDVAAKAIITDVEITADLSMAKVYFTTISPKIRKKILRRLEDESKKVRSLLGKEIHLKKTPEIHFIIDESEEKARHIDALLDSLHLGNTSEEDSSSEEDDYDEEYDDREEDGPGAGEIPREDL
ncbi:MAG TPA: 30S ribosome-binding factor RbfA [Synergistaceae bacterium]|nr:30S ribosome-binding factor RbfA [Synergistaceae bacterium]HPJ25237.1 30S ribosome-binding factor RbfA [Synergistaceae bacterium]HPQ36108.1 30S ribosome-binding factor RbfA [Synergistaceae bacterium]